jgi:hypothetical protein
VLSQVDGPHAQVRAGRQPRVRLRVAAKTPGPHRLVTMSDRPEEAGGWPEHLPVGALRVGRSSAHYEQAVRFYRDLVGLPVLENFATS